MNNINVDPSFVINDLLDQIRRLTADNAVLRAALEQVKAYAVKSENEESDD